MNLPGRLALAASFLACIPMANWLIGHVGTECVPNGPCLIPIAPGMMAPTGVIMIGVALALRDHLQEVAGRSWVLVCILAGAALSVAVSPAAIALASAFAFTLAELADWAVYSRLRARGRHVAVLASGAAGAVLDSILFSWLAFGQVKWAAGFIVAKLYAAIAFAAWIWWRQDLLPRSIRARLPKAERLSVERLPRIMPDAPRISHHRLANSRRIRLGPLVIHARARWLQHSARALYPHLFHEDNRA